MLNPEALSTWSKLAAEAVLGAGDEGSAAAAAAPGDNAWSEFRALGEQQKERELLRAEDEMQRRAQALAAEKARREQLRAQQESAERTERERLEAVARKKQAERARLDAERQALRERLAAAPQDEDEDGAMDEEMLMETFEQHGSALPFVPDLAAPDPISEEAIPDTKEEGEL